MRFGAWLVIGGLCVAMTAHSADEAQQRWWAHIQYLADDSLEGRQTGSEGHRKAAEYVAKQFAKAGLRPAGDAGGYVQSVPFISRRIVEERSHLSLERGGQLEALTLGEDATINMRISPAANVRAPLVFVGYGLTVPEVGHDDLAGMDLKGKVAVFFSGGPQNIPGPLLAHYQTAGERWSALKRAGAIGALTIQNPRGQDIPWDRSKLARLAPAMSIADAALDETAGQQIAVTVNPERAGKLFEGSGHAYADLLAAATNHRPLERFVLANSVVAEVAFESSKVTSQNIVGSRPGTDPRLKAEYVVISAHVDHLGIGEPVNGDRINNGAMDNASGIATLIEIAAALDAAKVKLKRSVLFVAVTAEEKGLLGSEYYASKPLYPLAKTVGVINMDALDPMGPAKNFTTSGSAKSDLQYLLVADAEKAGLVYSPDPHPEAGHFFRSDHFSFAKQGVPAFSFGSGNDLVTGGISAGEAAHKDYVTNRYHQPADEWQPTWTFAGMAHDLGVLYQVGSDLANSDRWPDWSKDSEFRAKRDETASERH